MTMITITIDDNTLEVPEGTTIMSAAEKVGIHIPRLCYHPSLSIEGACRICIVEAEGYRNYVTACSTLAEPGMTIKTHSPAIRRSRRDILELILDNHTMDCQTCDRDTNCELQSLAYSLGVRERLFEGKRKNHPIDDSSLSVVRNANKCILCQRCVRVCAEVQGVCNLQQQHRGFNTVVAPAHETDMMDSVCINCGQCINVCPTAAFVEKNYTDEVFEALADPDKIVIAHIAPSIRAAIAEGFDKAPGTPATYQTVTALRRLGFDYVFDTNFGADLTIVEEANEFVKRVQENRNLPLLTSCSPGWVKFMEHFYPELIANASTCLSPMGMLGALIKTYWANTMQVDPAKIYVVAIMPCTAKKFEIKRPEMKVSGHLLNDAVLTTRELIYMIKCSGINFNKLPDEPFDKLLGFSSGAGDIFGSTGGVMEAALRTAAEKITGQPLDNLEFTNVRAVEGLKEASIEIAGRTINVAVANGLDNAKTVLDKVQSGEKQYHLIEIMACPGGCVGGGGQPYPPQGYFVMDKEIVKQRASALYKIDKEKAVRKSHENPEIQLLYQNFLGEPGSHKAHELLHTHYQPREPRGIK